MVWIDFKSIWPPSFCPDVLLVLSVCIYVPSSCDSTVSFSWLLCHLVRKREPWLCFVGPFGIPCFFLFLFFIVLVGQRRANLFFLVYFWFTFTPSIIQIGLLQSIKYFTCFEFFSAGFRNVSPHLNSRRVLSHAMMVSVCSKTLHYFEKK